MIIIFQWIFLLYFYWSFLKFLRNSPTTMRRTSRTSSRWSSTSKVEIKIQYHIILFESFFFLIQVSVIPNYLEIKKKVLFLNSLFQCSKISQLETCKLSELIVSIYMYLFFTKICLGENCNYVPTML